MTRVAAYREGITITPKKCIFGIGSRATCWSGGPCRFYLGLSTDSEPRTGPVTVLCSAPVKKASGK